jgi:hypothetical protein
MKMWLVKMTGEVKTIIWFLALHLVVLILECCGRRFNPYQRTLCCIFRSRSWSDLKMYIYSLGLQTLTTAGKKTTDQGAFFARHCPLTGRYLEPWHGQTRTRVA